MVKKAVKKMREKTKMGKNLKSDRISPQKNYLPRIGNNYIEEVLRWLKKKVLPKNYNPSIKDIHRIFSVFVEMTNDKEKNDSINRIMRKISAAYNRVEEKNYPLVVIKEMLKNISEFEIMFLQTYLNSDDLNDLILLLFFSWICFYKAIENFKIVDNSNVDRETSIE